MHGATQVLAILLLAVAGYRARPSRALVVLTTAVVLVPSNVHLPTGFTSDFTATRITAVAVALSLVRTRRRDLLASTPLHLAAGVYAITAAVTGVLTVGTELLASQAFSAWLDLMDPLLIGLVGLACARAAGPKATLIALGAVAAVAVVAGTAEHVLGESLARLLFGGKGLQERAGQTRVRVGSDFALAFAWTVAALTPALVAVLRRRPALALLALTGCLAVGYWTFSRSVPVGYGIGVLVLAIGLRDRRTVSLVLAATVVLGVTAAAVPSVQKRFSAGVDQGALNVRSERAPIVLEAASQHPLGGLGLTGVAHIGVPETDDSFLLTYAETGLFGIIALLVVLGCGLVLLGRGLRGPPSDGRATATVCFAGALVMVVGAAAFDAFAIKGTAALIGLLLGVGIAAAESVAGPAPIARPLRDRPDLRVLLVGLAVGGGMVVNSQASSHFVETATFSTFSTEDLIPDFDLVDRGRALIATVCAVATSRPPADLKVDCSDSNTAAGVGSLRLEAAEQSQLDTALYEIVATIRSSDLVPHLTATPLPPTRLGVSTPMRTAPWSAGWTAFLLALLVPTEPIRRFNARTRGWQWTVDSGHVGSRPGSTGGATSRVREHGVEGSAEALEGRDLQPVGGDPLRS